VKHIVDLVDEVLKDKRKSKIVVYKLMEEGIIKSSNFGDSEVNDVAKAFKESFGVTKVSRYDRFACLRLIKAYGTENVIFTIKQLSQRSGERFAPTVNNISDLETKWLGVMRFLSDATQEVGE
jgi:hypothetical protein